MEYLSPKLSAIYNEQINRIPNDSTLIIDKIINLATNVGYTSLIRVNVCYFDNIHYSSDNNSDNNRDRDSDNDDNGICTTVVDCSGYVYPYNTIQYHIKNEWKFKALMMYMFIYRNLLPINSFYGSIDLPKQVNIKRTDGRIHTSIIRKDSGLKIKDDNKLYITLEFYNTGEIIEPYKKIYDTYIKSMELSEFLKINPDITAINATLINFTEQELNSADLVKKIVMKNFNKLQEHWINVVVNPIVEQYKIINIKNKTE